MSQSLAILHLGIASFTKFEEMELSKNEADALASATVNVLDQFDLRPDPRITAIVGLVTTAGTIYGPRYYIYKAKKKTEKSKDDKPEDSNIEPFISPITHGMLNG